jgi:hypothetical protein
MAPAREVTARSPAPGCDADARPGIEDGGMAHGSDLDRFVAAQAPLVEQVTRELRAGEKRSHWMRFVFPHLVGLGSGATARRYVIVSFD